MIWHLVDMDFFFGKRKNYFIILNKNSVVENYFEKYYYFQNSVLKIQF